MSNDPRFDLTNFEHQWLQSMAPSGFSLVMNHTRGGPEFLLSTYPQEWQEIYDRRNYIWLDPILLTAVSSDGDRLWTERKLPDLRGVLREGEKYGLNYGAIFSRTNIHAKSLLSVARSDREPTADECNELSAWFSNYCDRVFINEELTPQETDIIAAIADDYTVKEVALRLGISQTTVKERLISVRAKFKVKTNARAVATAIRRKII